MINAVQFVFVSWYFSKTLGAEKQPHLKLELNKKGDEDILSKC